MSKSTAYALNVITLAAWLSAALGAWIGFSVHQDWSVAFATKPQPLSVMSSVEIAASEPTETVETVTEEVPTETTVVAVTATLPAPPALPELAPMAELPEIPQLPAPVIRKTAPTVATAPATPRPQSPPANPRPQSSASNTSSNTSPASATSLSFGSGAGIQPAPSYPLQARRSNQQGTVVIEFLVGIDGKVLSAWVKTPCAYDLLNNAALSTIRSRWKFSSGPARRYKIPIVFRLN